MALLFPAAYQFLNANASPVASGTLTFYDTGTTDLRAIYSDADMQVAASNPYSLDAAGRIAVNLYGSGRYTVVCKSASDVQIWSRDDVFGWYEAPQYERTASEVAAGVTPSNYQYVPGDVRRYGATGDGATDDTVAVQKAIDSGHEVSFGGPEFVYVVDGLELADDGDYRLIGHGATLKLKGSATADILVNADTTFVSNLVIDGLIFDGNKSGNSGWTVGGISVHVDFAEITNCTFKNCKPYSLRFAHVASAAKVHGCTFTDGAEHSGTLNENSIYLECRSSSTRATSTKQNIVITGNQFIGITPSVAGQGVGGVIVSGFSTAAVDETHRMLIANNTFWNCGQDAASNKVASIVLYRRGGRSIISNNAIYDGDENGIDVQGSDNVVVTGNVIHGVTVDGIVIAPRDSDKACSEIVVSSNVISGCNVGVRARFSDGLEGRNLSVSGNAIRNCAQGIQVRYVDGNVSINGNILEDITDASPSTGDRAIDVYLCDGNISINGNSCIDSENVFIDVREVTGLVSIEGNVGTDFGETRPIRLVTVSADCVVRGNVLKTMADTEALGFSTVTGRCVVEGNVAPSGSTFYQISSPSILMGKNNVGQATQTLSGAGAISPSIPTTLLVTTGANAITLADGLEGQQKTIRMKTDGGVGTVTPTNFWNGTTLAFDDEGDYAVLEFVDGKWLMTAGTATVA